MKIEDLLSTRPDTRQPKKRKPKAKKIPQSTWDSHQQILEKLYMLDDQPVKHVVTFMERDYNFIATYDSSFRLIGVVDTS